MTIRVEDYRTKEVFGVELILARVNYPYGTGTSSNAEYALVRGVNVNKFIVSITHLTRTEICKSCGSASQLSSFRSITLTYDSLSDSEKSFNKLSQLLTDISGKRGGKKK